jgi:hypothetical protein
MSSQKKRARGEEGSAAADTVNSIDDDAADSSAAAAPSEGDAPVGEPDLKRARTDSVLAVAPASPPASDDPGAAALLEAQRLTATAGRLLQRHNDGIALRAAEAPRWIRVLNQLIPLKEELEAIEESRAFAEQLTSNAGIQRSTASAVSAVFALEGSPFCRVALGSDVMHMIVRHAFPRRRVELLQGRSQQKSKLSAKTLSGAATHRGGSLLVLGPAAGMPRGAYLLWEAEKIVELDPDTGSEVFYWNTEKAKASAASSLRCVISVGRGLLMLLIHQRDAGLGTPGSHSRSRVVVVDWLAIRQGATWDAAAMLAVTAQQQVSVDGQQPSDPFVDAIAFDPVGGRVYALGGKVSSNFSAYLPTHSVATSGSIYELCPSSANNGLEAWSATHGAKISHAADIAQSSSRGRLAWSHGISGLPSFQHMPAVPVSWSSIYVDPFQRRLLLVNSPYVSRKQKVATISDTNVGAVDLASIGSAQEGTPVAFQRVLGPPLTRTFYSDLVFDVAGGRMIASAEQGSYLSKSYRVNLFNQWLSPETGGVSITTKSLDKCSSLAVDPVRGCLVGIDRSIGVLVFDVKGTTGAASARRTKSKSKSKSAAASRASRPGAPNT